MALSNASVSLCMIVRNEAHQLAACLEPIAGLFDDIVIVDTGSSDGTREVAQRFTSQVVDFVWCDDFSAARNAALRDASGEWIFWLDADDRFSPENVERLRELLAGLSDEPRAFLMQVVLHLDDECRDRQRIVSHLRLFRRHPALQWQRRVHEQLVPWPAALGHEVLSTNIQIDHLGYRDTGLMQRKLRRNLRLLNIEFAVAPDDPALLVDLGYAYAQLGKPEEARRHLHAALHHPRRSRFLRRRAFTTLGELETALGNFAPAAELLASASEEFPDDDYLLYMQSEALYNLGCADEAQAALSRILDKPPTENQFLIGAPADLRERLAPLALGEVLRSQLELCQAERVLRGVADRFPNDPSAWWFLGRVYIDWRHWDKLAAVLARLDRVQGGAVYADILRASSDFARSRWLAAEATLERLIAQVPAMILPRVLRAECLFHRQAPPAAQLQAWRDVLRLQPHNARALEMLQTLDVSAVRGDGLASLCTSVVLGAGVPEGLSTA